MASSHITCHYPWPSAVNVSNFISTKLSINYPNTNYKIWKDQMLCLIEGQDLRGFIDGSILPPMPQEESYGLWRRTDRLLKGWILGSLHEDVLSQVAALETARDVWRELETQFYELTQFQLHQQNTSAKKLWFTGIDTNYEIWREQILCLIEGQGLLSFIDGSIPPPQAETQDEYYLHWTRSDRVVKAWILRSLHQTLVSEVVTRTTARDVWLELENKFSQLLLRCQNLGRLTTTELWFTDTDTNYEIWKGQVLRLIEDHGFNGFIDGSIPPPQPKTQHEHHLPWMKRDRVVKAWILSSLDETLVSEVKDLTTARDIWLELKTKFSQFLLQCQNPGLPTTTELWFTDTDTNYEIWKGQVLRLIESHGFTGFIGGSIFPPQPETQHEHYLLWMRRDRVVKAWILRSLHQTLVSEVEDLTTARDIWLELKTKFSQFLLRCQNPSLPITTELWFTDSDTNYEIWKGQVLRLIEGQGFTGFIDGRIPPPQPETQHEDYLLWMRRDRVVKAWILSSLDETLVFEVEDMTTARDIWLELKTKFSQVLLRCENPGLPTTTELWFIDTDTNYEIWKGQVLRLIEGHGFTGFIDGSIPPPQPEIQDEHYLLWMRGDRVVKAWILSSLNETLVSEVEDLTTARDIWLELKTKFSQFLLRCQNPSLPITTELWFTDNDTNYEIWKGQLLCLIKGHYFTGFIDGSIPPPQPERQHKHYFLWMRKDRVVKALILSSLNETLVSKVEDLTTARDIWLGLKTKFFQFLLRCQNPGLPITTELRFTDTDTNYEIWKDQVFRLIEGHDYTGFINGSSPPPQHETQYEHYLLWMRRDRVVKAWILSSLDETLVSELEDLSTAREIWLELETKFSQFQQRRCQNTGKHYMEYAPLFKAVWEGNWEAAKTIFDRDPTAVTARIDPFGLTALHVAAGLTGRKAIHLVQKMVEIMPDDAIAQTTIAGRTALHYAAASGNVEAARILVNRMPRLPSVSNNFSFPIQAAASFAQRETVKYLISVTQDRTPYVGVHGVFLFTVLVLAGYFDIALGLVVKYPNPDLIKLKCDGVSPLSLIAGKKTVSGVGSGLGFWERFIPSRFSTLDKQMKANPLKSLAGHMLEQIKTMTSMEALEICTEALTKAAKADNSDLVQIIIEAYPNLINHVESDSGRSIFHIAMENRSERVFNLMNRISGYKKQLWVNSRDKHGNTALHAAAKQAPSHKLNQISGAATQMQRELQWYKGVEKQLRPGDRDLKNKDNKTAQMIFTEEHKQLKGDGEKWMKDTSQSCSIAAALIVTIMFAAAITVPGDYDDATGFPKFSKDSAFIVFGFSNAISLFTSTTSLLMFLSIFTSRYAEVDFLYALPKRLIIGLGMLFVSVLFMMVAFIVTVYLVVGQKNPWIFGPLAALACLPVSSFVLLQFPLLFDLISSTYGPGILGKQSDRPFY